MNKVLGYYILLIWSFIGYSQEINFSYELKRDCLLPNQIQVNAEIINNSKENLYFITESCNGFDHFLETNNEKTEILILIYCNTTFPIKHLLRPSKSYKFTSIVRTKEQIEQLSLNLKMIKVSKFTDVENKFVNELEKKPDTEIIKLIGKTTQIQ